jgi:hypothetical protein
VRLYGPLADALMVQQWRVYLRRYLKAKRNRAIQAYRRELREERKRERLGDD